MNSKRTNLRLGMAVAIAGILVCTHQAAQRHAARATQLDRSPFVKQSKQIFRRILQSGDASVITVERIRGCAQVRVAGLDLVRVQMWDDARDAVVTLDWQAETGELIAASNKLHVPPESHLPMFSRAEAARTSLRWLRVLGIASARRMWKLALVHDSRGIYVARWTATGLEATITIQYRSGELSTVRVRRSEQK